MNDKELLDMLDLMITPQSRLEIFEEDGGVIIMCQNPNGCYVGTSIREALNDMLRTNYPMGLNQ